MEKGVIVKLVRGIYYVNLVEQNNVIPCKARGKFREESVIPMVGDQVMVRISEEDGSGYIESIDPRSSELLRPPVANVNQVMIVMSIDHPKINLNLLDKYLLLVEKEGLKSIIVFNKSDIAEQKKLNQLMETYQRIGYPVFANSNVEFDNNQDFRELLNNKITVFTGPSGVGKSTLLNRLNKQLELKTGDISKKNKRGKHTTRHTELIQIFPNAYVLDTPGFSSLSMEFIETKEEIRHYFPEFRKVGKNCRFLNCLHLNEPDCAVKEALKKDQIAESRYTNYQQFIEELEKRRKY